MNVALRGWGSSRAIHVSMQQEQSLDGFEGAEFLSNAVGTVVASYVPFLAAGRSVCATVASLCGGLRGALEKSSYAPGNVWRHH